MYTISKLYKMVQRSVTSPTETSENGLLIGLLWYHTASWVPLYRVPQGFSHLCRGESLNLNRLHYLRGWRYWCRVHFPDWRPASPAAMALITRSKLFKGVKIKESDDFV